MFILGSVAPYSKKSVVPQSPADLSDDDRQRLSELGLPPDKWDNLNALLAMYNKTEAYDVFSVQISKPGMELSCSYVLEQIEFLLMNSVNKECGGERKFLQLCIVFHAILYFSQLYSTTMAIAGGTLATGVSKMATSPSEISLAST